MRPSPLSIFDRLTGVEPGFDPSRTRQRQVLADVRNLLNSRLPQQEIPNGLEEARNSILTYGLPDFAAMTVNSGFDKQVVRRAIEQVIRTFEPRLDQVRVKLVEGPNQGKNAFLDYRIEGVLLHEDGDREAVAFDTRLDHTKGGFTEPLP